MLKLSAVWLLCLSFFLIIRMCEMTGCFLVLSARHLVRFRRALPSARYSVRFRRHLYLVRFRWQGTWCWRMTWCVRVMHRRSWIRRSSDRCVSPCLRRCGCSKPRAVLQRSRSRCLLARDTKHRSGNATLSHVLKELVCSLASTRFDRV